MANGLERTQEEDWQAPQPAARSPLLHEILHLLFPWSCLACRSKIGSRGAVLGLCAACARRLLPAVEPTCRRCAAPLPASAAGQVCGPCQQRHGAWRRIHAGWFYDDTLGQVVHAIKFGRVAFLAQELGHRLAMRFEDALAAVDVVTFVPLHWRRRLHRRFDQAEVIARALAADAGVPCRRLLRRVRPTPPQSQRSRRQRLHGLGRAFKAYRTDQIRGRRVALVDDVVTTCATIDAASAALSRGLPASITVFAAARTPRH